MGGDGKARDVKAVPNGMDGIFGDEEDAEVLGHPLNQFLPTEPGRLRYAGGDAGSLIGGLFLVSVDQGPPHVDRDLLGCVYFQEGSCWMVWLGEWGCNGTGLTRR